MKVADNAVLLVVDVQVGFINRDTSQIPGDVAEFARRWTHGGRHASATKFVNQPGSSYERLIGWTRLREPAETELAPAVAALKLPTFEKTVYSGLTPELIRWLDKDFSGDLYLCGIATDGCVLKTAVDAFELGWTPWVITDLCASHGGHEIHEAGLALLERFIGGPQLVTSAELLDSLEKRAP